MHFNKHSNLIFYEWDILEINMQPLNSDQDSEFHNQLWYLLTEYSLSEFLANHDKGGELMGGFLSQKMRELGMSLENFESIDQMLAEFAEEAMMDIKPGSPEAIGRIRVFCQQKMIYAANSEQTARLYAGKQAMEPMQKNHPSGTKMDGGWGSFLIKRGGNVSEDASISSYQFIDLYLYREG